MPQIFASSQLSDCHFLCVDFCPGQIALQSDGVLCPPLLLFIDTH